MRTDQTPGTQPRDWSQALRHFLAAKNRREAERELERLHREFFSVTANQVLTEELRRGVPASKEELDETQDTFNDVSLIIRAKIAQRLLTLWEQPEPKDNIQHLHAYVVAVARNGCVDYLRRKYPGRHALDNSLRAALANRPHFALWRTPIDGDIQEWRCGKSEWRDQQRPPVELRFDEALQKRLDSIIQDLSRADTLPIIFDVAQAPLRFIELLSFLSTLWDVEAPYRAAEREYVPFRVPKPYQSGLQPEEIVSIIGTLQKIWELVQPLSSVQAAVLLLKLPQLSSGSCLEGFVRFQVATWFDLAKVMNLAPPQLKQIADDVPLEDVALAELLGLVPAVIPRIRQDARRRLKGIGSRRGASTEN